MQEGPQNAQDENEQKLRELLGSVGFDRVMARINRETEKSMPEIQAKILDQVKAQASELTKTAVQTALPEVKEAVQKELTTRATGFAVVVFAVLTAVAGVGIFNVQDKLFSSAVETQKLVMQFNDQVSAAKKEVESTLIKLNEADKKYDAQLKKLQELQGSYETELKKLESREARQGK